MILLSFRLFGDCEHNILIAEVIQQRDLERDADLGNVRVEAEVRQQADHHLAHAEGHHVPHHEAQTLPPAGDVPVAEGDAAVEKIAADRADDIANGLADQGREMQQLMCSCERHPVHARVEAANERIGGKAPGARDPLLFHALLIFQSVMLRKMLYFVGEKPPTAPRCTYRQCFSKQTGTMGAVSEIVWSMVRQAAARSASEAAR